MNLRDARQSFSPAQLKAVYTGQAPYSPEAEAGALSCVLQEPERMAELARAPVDLFFDLRHATLFKLMREMYAKLTVIDPVTVQQWVKDRRQLKNVGGHAYLSELPDKAPSPANLPYYLVILREKYALRNMIHVCHTAAVRIHGNEGDVQSLMLGIQAELDICSRMGLDGKQRRQLEVFSAGALEKVVLNPAMRLIGDNEICTGYDGVALMAGPGGSGKSLCTLTLALAGALGTGFWMGRKVHRQFRTLIIQAENGLFRLKTEFEALKRQHPDVDLDAWIAISEPPEGGLPFHRGDFRTAVREAVARFKPDLVVIDPWAQVASDDGSKEVVDKLAEIRSCFPAGDECPGLCIVAHTKKPRAEEVRKGRGLAHNVSGSIALVNTARCVYMLLPWNDDPDDDRIYWCCAKLNNGEMYAPSVWRRRFGTFFLHDDKTDPREWGRSEDDREKISGEQLRDAFGKDVEVASGALVKRLAKVAGAGESTCWRAIGEDGYLRPLLMRSGHGKLKLKE
ncbi:MAG: AAA family ATPase [Verrucomicrobiae bacterium]|nr:AAA family ATPase [Verrucomicrobiae bacterium]